jgi:hypothetical protein
MSFLDRIRNWLAGPPHIQGGDDEGGEAALHEEYGTPTEGDAAIKATESGSGGAVMPGYAAARGAEAAEAETSSEEAPPDAGP